MSDWVEWVEPFVETDTGTEAVIMRVSKKAAIAQARKVAEMRGCGYDSDQEALEDFIAVHWAVQKTDSPSPAPYCYECVCWRSDGCTASCKAYNDRMEALYP